MDITPVSSSSMSLMGGDIGVIAALPEKKMRTETHTEFLVFKGRQPIYSDRDEMSARVFLETQKIECKLLGIDTNTLEHGLKIYRRDQVVEVEVSE